MIFYSWLSWFFSGELKAVFKAVAGGLTVVSAVEVLSRWSSFDQVVATVQTCLLPAGTSLVQVTDSCVCLTVQAESLSALKNLWKLYQDRTLQKCLCGFFFTDEVKELADREDVGGEYRHRWRRISDSFYRAHTRDPRWPWIAMFHLIFSEFLSPNYHTGRVNVPWHMFDIFPALRVKNQRI